MLDIFLFVSYDEAWINGCVGDNDIVVDGFL